MKYLPMMKKLFKAKPVAHHDIIEKETVDEIIFRTNKPKPAHSYIAKIGAFTMYLWTFIKIKMIAGNYPSLII